MITDDDILKIVYPIMHKNEKLLGNIRKAMRLAREAERNKVASAIIIDDINATIKNISYLKNKLQKHGKDVEDLIWVLNYFKSFQTDERIKYLEKGEKRVGEKWHQEEYAY